MVSMMMRLFFWYLLLFPALCIALTFPLPATGNKIGVDQTVISEKEDTLADIGRYFDMGVHEMIAANPKVNPQHIPIGTKILIPSHFVLPDTVPRQGIVINLTQMRAYYYHPDEPKVSTFPLGIGKQGWATPRGTTKIVSKEKNPTWHIPASIRREEARRGKKLPLVVLPGPKNPLGKYALHLGFSGILMHGTNAPHTIGLRSSHGCMRMYPEDIEQLFQMVPIGTPVHIINEDEAD